jgi:O-antigen/teichoic acid export membrane protein
VLGAEKAKGVKASRIFRSASALMFSTVASSALGMVFWIVAARLFDTQEVGRASAAVSAIMLLGGFGQLGLSSLLIRFVPIIGSAVGRLLRGAYLISTSVSLVFGVAFVTLGFGRQFLGQGAMWTAAFCVAVVCGCVSSMQDGVLTALKRTNWVPVENIAIAIARLALLPALIATASVNPVLIAWGVPMVGAVAVISVALFRWLLPKHVRVHAGRVRMPSRRELIKFTSAGYANGVVGNLTTYLPPVIITAVLGPAANAVFFVPWLIATVIYGLLWNIASSFVVEATSDAAHTATYLRHATRLVLLVGVGGTVTLVAGAPWLLALLGKEYSAGGTTALRLVGLIVPCSCVIVTYTVSLLMQRKNWAIFRLSCVSAVLSLPLAVVGMYRYGISGVVGGFLVADAIVAVCLLPAVVRRYRALANRSIDDDVTMVVDLALLRAELSNAAVGPHDHAAEPGANDETAVLDMAALQAELRQHDRGGFTSTFADWSRANQQTVVLDAVAAELAEEAQTTAVFARIDDAPTADAVEVVPAPTLLAQAAESVVLKDEPDGRAGADGLAPQVGVASRAAPEPSTDNTTFSWFN